MDTSLELTYFNDNKGRNELIRLIFAVGEVPYRDNLISFTEYQSLRDADADEHNNNNNNNNSLPYGQLPVLTVDGTHTYGQACSIARYAAKIGGIYPSSSDNLLDSLKSDGVVDAWRDICDLFYETIFTRRIVGGKLMMIPHPQSERYGRLKEFVTIVLPDQFDRYERILAESLSSSSSSSSDNDDDDLEDSSSFCPRVCTSMESFPSWADLAIYDITKTIEGATDEQTYNKLMSNKPLMKRLVNKIDNLECIKKHLVKYPYNDVSYLWSKVPYWKQILEVFVYPIMIYVFTIMTIVKSKFKTSFTNNNNKNKNNNNSITQQKEKSVS